MFDCGAGPLSITYHYHKLFKKEWKEIEVHFEKKISSKGKLLSFGQRIVLSNEYSVVFRCLFCRSL
jgi:hypothetical protein